MANTLKSFFSRSKKVLRLELGYSLGDAKLYQICSSNDPRMTFDFFTARSSFCPSCWGNTGRILHRIRRYAIAELTQVSELRPIGLLFLSAYWEEAYFKRKEFARKRSRTKSLSCTNRKLMRLWSFMWYLRIYLSFYVFIFFFKTLNQRWKMFVRTRN